MMRRISAYLLLFLIILPPLIDARAPGIREIDGRIIDASVSSSGYLAYSDSLGYVHVISPSGDELMRVRVTNATRCAYLDISDSGRLAVLSKERIMVLSLNGTVVWSRENPHSVKCGMQHPIKISPDGSLVVIAWDGDRYIAGYSGDDGKILWQKILRGVKGVYHSPRCRYLAVLNEDSLAVFNTTTGERDSRFREVYTMQPLVDDEGYYAIMYADTLTLFSPSGDELWTRSFQGAIFGGTFLPDHRRIVILMPTDDRTDILVLDEDGRIVREDSRPFFISAVRSSPDGSRMVLWGNSQAVYSLDGEARKLGDEMTFMSSEVPVDGYPKDEGAIAVGSIGRISLYDAEGRRWTIPLPQGLFDFPMHVTFSLGGSTITAPLINGTILVLNSTDGSIELKAFRELSFPTFSVASDDAKYLLVDYEDAFFVYENSNGSAEVLFAKSGYEPLAIPSPDWRRILYTNDEGVVLATLSGEKIRKIDLGSHPCALTAYKDRFVVSTENKTVYVLSTDGELINSFEVDGNLTNPTLMGETSLLFYVQKEGGTFELLNLDLESGKVLWTKEFELVEYPVGWRAFCAGGGGIMLGDAAGRIYSLSDGSPRQIRDLRGEIDVLVCGLGRPILAMLTTGEIEVWKFGEGGVGNTTSVSPGASSGTTGTRRRPAVSVTGGQALTALALLGLILTSVIATWVYFRSSSRRMGSGGNRAREEGYRDNGKGRDQ